MPKKGKKKKKIQWSESESLMLLHEFLGYSDCG